jgi:hypothetical protein
VSPLLDIAATVLVFTLLAKTHLVERLVSYLKRPRQQPFRVAEETDPISHH